MFRSLTVSAYFIKKGLQEGTPISPMKLQKLLYFAHGWHLGNFGEPLLYEEFEAWKFGPVLPNVYYHFKSNGPFPIKELPLGISFDEVYQGLNNFLNAVWEAYKPFTGEALSAMTHQPGSPWDRVYKPNVNNIPIPNKEIERYFVGLKAQRDVATATQL